MQSIRSILFLVAVVLINLFLADVAQAIDVPTSLTILPSKNVNITNLDYSSGTKHQKEATKEGIVEINFDLSKKANVTVQIKNVFDNEIVFTEEPFLGIRGRNCYKWNDGGAIKHFIEPSWYTCIIKATDGLSSDNKSIEMRIAKGQPLRLRVIGYKPGCIRLSQGAVFKIHQSRDAYVNIDIRDNDGVKIRGAYELKWQNGENQFVWDCLDDGGRSVKTGKYTINIKGKDSSGNIAYVSENLSVEPDRKLLMEIAKDAIMGIFSLKWHLFDLAYIEPTLPSR